MDKIQRIMDRILNENGQNPKNYGQNSQLNGQNFEVKGQKNMGSG